MKSFASSVTAFALLSTILAKSSGKNGTQLEGENPIFLNEPVDVPFRMLEFNQALPISYDPTNTFIFSISLPPNKGQKLSINVTGIRTAVPNVELSVSQCNWSGEFCYPEMGSKTARPFDHTLFANGNNVASLDVSKVASNGTFFFFYLQVPMKPGQDNPSHRSRTNSSIENDNTPDFIQIKYFEPKDNLSALTFSLSQ